MEHDLPTTLHGEGEHNHPHLHLSEDEIPGLKDWKVGEVHTVELTIKETDSHLEGDEIDASFCVVNTKHTKHRKHKYDQVISTA